MSDTESVGAKKRRMEKEMSSSSGGRNEGSILGQVIQELKDIEVETPNARTNTVGETKWREWPGCWESNYIVLAKYKPESE